MDRTEFAKRLYETAIPAGTSQEDMNRLVLPLSKAIFEMMPSSLFRYRPLFDRQDKNSKDTNNQQIDAFEKDTIYAVTADKFNDPYDTLVKYDKEEIKHSVNTIVSCGTLEAMKDWFAQGNDLSAEVKQILPLGLTEFLKSKLLSIDDVSTIKDNIEESRQRMINSIETYFPILTEMAKKYSAMACFSESADSILMWSHYANSHHGFTLEYDFRPTFEKPIKNVGIYPVIYDDKRMDASLYMGWLFLRFIGIEANNPDISAYLKVALHKSSIWAYEREWRLIDSTPREVNNNSPSVISYKPVAIYYGRYISGEHKARLHEIAQKKSILEYEMYVDYSSPKYEMKYRECYK